MGSDQFDALRLELRRGCLVMAVLAQLRVEHYGYTLKNELADRGPEHRRRHALPAVATTRGARPTRQ